MFSLVIDGIYYLIKCGAVLVGGKRELQQIINLQLEGFSVPPLEVAQR